MSEISKEKKEEIRQSEDYKTARKILDALHLNMQRAKEFRRPHFELFQQMCHDSKKKWEESKKASAILRRLKMADHSSPEYESMSKMLAYLGLIESLGVALVDMTLILLIANGKDVHTRGPYTKHVTSFEELERIDLGYKLDFLNVEGLNLFKKFMNQEVRNHIAHLKFRVDKSGKIRKPGKPGKDCSPIHIDAEIEKFWLGVDTLKLVFEDIGFMKWMKEKALQGDVKGE